MAKKPTLETHSYPCCGQCSFCHKDELRDKKVKCWIDKPKFSHFDNDEAVYLRGAEVDVKDPACSLFDSKLKAN